MRLLRRLSAAIAVTVTVGACGGGTPAEPPDYVTQPGWAEAFDAEGVQGSFVLIEIGSEAPPLVYDVTRTRRDLAPAETFKILTTLIALEADVLTSLDTELTWDGEGPEVPPWNRTHTLRSALGTESDWFYAQVADIIGLDPMEVWINRAHFGNANVRGSRASFWSDGTLLVDALQQAKFYADLFSDDPTFDRYTAFDVKELMHNDQRDGFTLTWFTGTDAVTQGTPIGWMVGAVTTDDGTWAFAMNLDLPEDAGLDLDLRKRLTMRVLESEGIIGVASS